MKPTAPLAIPASARTLAAKGTWKPGPKGTGSSGTANPEEQSIRSTPISFNCLARRTDWSISQPPPPPPGSENPDKKRQSAGPPPPHPPAHPQGETKPVFQTAAVVIHPMVY